MSTRPWMPLYVNDFRLDTLDLDCAQIGVYLALLMLAWRREDAALPNDMDWMKRSLKSCFSRFHGHEFNRIVPGLLERYFVLEEDGKWHNKRLTNERQKADKLRVKQKQNADKRWSKYKENNDLPDASAMPSQSQSQSQSQEERIDIVQTIGLNAPPQAVPAKKASDLDPLFLAFYLAYPRRQARKDAAKAYAQSRKDGISHEAIMLGLERAKRTDRRFRDPEYTPLPASWLRKGCFDDEPMKRPEENWEKVVLA